MQSPRLTPTAVRAPLGAPWLELSWADGFTQRIPAIILRGYCPCAQCQGHGGAILFQTGHDHELRDIKPVGNYALQITWGDGHSAGLHSFEYLRALAELYSRFGDRLPEVHPKYPGPPEPEPPR